VTRFADITAKETAKEHGCQLKEARAYERHRIRQQLTAGARRDFHENKIVRVLPYALRRPHQSSPPLITEYARALRHLQAPNARWRAEKNSAQPHTPGPWVTRRGRLGGRPHALWRRSLRSPRRERFARSENCGHTQIVPAIARCTDRRHAHWRLTPTTTTTNLSLQPSSMDLVPHTTAAADLKAQGRGRWFGGAQAP
jgi:hypothetical protein